MRFYHVTILSGMDTGVAFGPKDWNPYSLRYGVEAAASELPPLKMDHGGFVDYQPGQVNLCSEKLMCVIELNKAENDRIGWFGATIEDARSEFRQYYALHMPVVEPVLNEEKTVFAGEQKEFVVRPHFNMEAIKARHVFSYRGNINSWVVSAHMRSKILEAGCTGLVFLDVEAS